MNTNTKQFELLPIKTSSSLERKAHGTATVRFDGGCRGNPGQKYGSWKAQLHKDIIERNRIDLGYGTNNEAEFDTLSLGLESLIAICDNTGIAKETIRVHVYTDSTIVRNRLTRDNRAKAHPMNQHKRDRSLAMKALADICLAKLSYFHSFDVTWEPRHRNVATFGH